MNINVAAPASASVHPSPSCLPAPAVTLASPSTLPTASTPASPLPRAASIPIDQAPSSLVSYHDPATLTLGCSHYSRKCQIHAPCCKPNTFYPCRFCHDEQADHKIDRHAISDMACMLCCQQAVRTDQPTARSQPVAETCVDCSQSMARYWCSVCKFFDDEPGRDIFHCTACGICRRGKRDEFFHCQRCNCCYASSLRAGHKCIENVLSSVCPICLEDLFSSTLPVNFLRCGHAIHVSCLDSLLYQPDQSTPWRCPTCKRSITSDPNNDLQIELYLRECPMPVEYSAWRAVILCNDCVRQTELSYHFAYHRCPHCRSFNTDVITVKRIERGSEDDLSWRRLPSAYEAARAAGIDPNTALQAGWQQIRDDDEEEEEEEAEDDDDDDDEVKDGDEAAGEEEGKKEDECEEVEMADVRDGRSGSSARTQSPRPASSSSADGYVEVEEPISDDWQEVGNGGAGQLDARDSDGRARWNE